MSSKLLPQFPLLIASLLVAACSSVEAASEEFDSLNTEQVEFGATIDPVTGDVYFVRNDAAWGTDARSNILRSRKTDHGWSDPEPVFPDLLDTSDPYISADGEFLYFVRPVERADGSNDADIWRSRRLPNGWEQPEVVEGVNSRSDEYSPVLSPDGTLYFASAREGGFGQGDIWSAAPAGQSFAGPKNLGPAINSPTGEWNLGISPDGSMLIFEASGRATNKSVPGDLYLSKRIAKGWGVPIALNALNTTGSELMPRFSQDGQTLFYSSSFEAGSTHTDLFSVPLATAMGEKDELLLAVASRSAHEIAIVSLAGNAVVNRLPTGQGPHEVALSADGSMLFVPAFGIFPTPHEEPIEPQELSWDQGPSGNLTIWPVAGDSSSKSEICSNAHAVAVTPNDGHVWITCEEIGEILELDRHGEEILRHWQSGGEGTHKLAVDRTGRFVIAANTDSSDISIIDRQTGVTSQVTTAPGAEGLSLSSDGLHVWVGNTRANSVSLVQIATGQLVRTFPSAGRFPVNLTAVPNTDELWVVNTFSRSVSVFGADGEEPIATLQFDTPPLGIIASPDGSQIVLSFPRRNEIAVIDRSSREETARINGVMEADGMAWFEAAARSR